MSEVAICDSTCLIALENIGHLDLLFRTFDQLIIPPAVSNEWGSSADCITVQPVRYMHLIRAFKTQIDAGESEVIALAMEFEDVVVILDDKKARRVAEEMELNVMGTIGLILRAKRKGIISNVKPILDELIQIDFRISNALYQQALVLAKEE